MVQGKIRVVIADDHALIRLGIRKVLESSPDIQVVGEAGNGQEAVDATEELLPDVLVLDIQMPVMDGIEALEYLQRCGTKARVLVLSAYNDPRYISEVLERGAWGYYLKDDGPTVIADAVRLAARGKGKGARPQPARKALTG